MPGPCPRTVTIRITNNQIAVQPPSVTIDRDCQSIQWNLVTDGSGTFADEPITFPPVPTSGPQPACGSYTPWPSTGTIQKTGPMQWEANANSPVPPGGSAVCYKYDVNWSGGVLDPDIENDPYPPGDADKDKDKDKDKDR